jgi:hypothetical protein
MASSDNLLWMQNPQIANALRRKKMGESLMQQGSDYSPVQSPWQGVARVAQALLGGYQARKADETINEVGEQSRREVEDFDRKWATPSPQAMGAALSAPDGAAPGTAPVAPVQSQPLPAPGSSELMGLVAPIAQKYGVPLQVAMALIQQESGGNPEAVGDGGQSVGLGQIQARTAQQPGYGVPPMDPARRNDPAANVDFALNYLTSKGRALGATDWNNPEHVDRALAAYNGGGDPNYVQNVRGRMGGEAPQGAPGGGMGAQPPQQPPQGAPQGPDWRQTFAMAQEALASRNPQLQARGQALMQRAQMEQREALQRQPQPKNPIQIIDPSDPTGRRRIWVDPERATGMQAPGAEPMVNVDVRPNPPEDHRAVYDDNGRVSHYEVMEGTETDRKIKQERVELREQVVGTGQTIELLDSLLKHPGLSLGTGATGRIANRIPGTPAYDFQTRLNQVQGRAFLEAYETLKGGGHITEIEGKKATEAKARLDAAQSEDAFRESIQELSGILQKGRERMLSRLPPDEAEQLRSQWSTPEPQFKDGAIAENPQTGEKIIFRRGKWEPVQ